MRYARPAELATTTTTASHPVPRRPLPVILGLGSTRIFELHLHDLECVQQEDATGADACRLELLVDSGPRDPYPLRKEMTIGDVWSINQKIGFDTDVVVKLWEEDATSFDDLLGSHTIGTTAVAGEEFEFGDVSSGIFFIYRLKYTVTALPGSKVDHAIGRLAASTVSSPWSHVSRPAVETRLNQLVGTASGDPTRVRQGSTPFCGLAGLAYELADRQPVRLVRFCHALLDTGSCLLADSEYEVSDDLLNSTIPGSTEEAEWLFCASMRESRHLIVDVQDDIFMGNAPLPLGAGQLFAVLHAGWPVGLSVLATDVLGHGNAVIVVTPAVAATINQLLSTPIVPDSEEAILRRAGQARGNGGWGLLLIDAGIFSGHPPGSTVVTPASKFVTFPGHYVSCLTPNPVSGTSVDCELQSWGGKYRIQTSLENFKPFLFGVIAVEP